MDRYKFEIEIKVPLEDWEVEAITRTIKAVLGLRFIAEAFEVKVVAK